MEPSAQTCISTMFQSLKNKTDRLLAPLAQAEGLTPLQVCVLQHVAAGGEITVGAVSERTGVGQANTSALCKKLEQAGCLTRARSAADGRVVTLSLTDKGREAVERFQAGVDRYLALLKDLDPGLREDFLRGVSAADRILDFLYDQSRRSGDAKGE